MTWRAALAVACAIAVGVAPASASPVAVTGIRAHIDSSSRNGKLFDTLSQDCISMLPITWNNVYRHKDKFAVIVDLPGATASGSFDALTKSGSLASTGTAFEFFWPETKKAFDVRALGLEVGGGHAYLTGQIVSTRFHFAAVKRQRIAVIAHPKFTSGPQAIVKHPTQHVANSFSVRVQGTATVAPAFAATINRLRCTKVLKFLRPRPLRAGSPFGTLNMELLPTGAVGTAGVVDMPEGPRFFTDTGDPVQVAPIAPARKRTINGGSTFQFGLPATTHAALTCQVGARCVPAEAARLDLLGGFTITANGHSATVDGLAISYEAIPGRAGPPSPRIFGRLNGQDMTIAVPDSASQAAGGSDFLAALSSALGVNMTEATFELFATFSDTAAL